MKLYVLAFGLTIFGCGANYFSGKTIASYKTTTTLPDGTVIVKEIVYNSNKEQQGLEMNLDEEEGRVKALKLHVDKASTQEQVIAASLALQLKVTDLLQTLTPLLGAAARGAGT